MLTPNALVAHQRWTESHVLLPLTMLMDTKVPVDVDQKAMIHRYEISAITIEK